jgi:GntR family transcriptional repressor for pyruvate dehydrogenase complex
MAPRFKKLLRDDARNEYPVTTRLVSQLIDLIDRGEMRPGERLLSERDLARKLSVSRQSLRTGIASLVMIGVLKSRHGQGTFVSPDILLRQSNSPPMCGGFVSSQLFEAQIRIEAIVAELAMPRLTHKHMGELAEEVVEMHAALDDPQKYSIHSMRFHRIIARAASNAILYAMLETITTNLYKSRLHWNLPSQDLRKSADIHREIYRAIRSRNAPQVKRLIEENLRTTFSHMEVVHDRGTRGDVPAGGTAQLSNGSYG